MIGKDIRVENVNLRENEVWFNQKCDKLILA